MEIQPKQLKSLACYRDIAAVTELSTLNIKAQEYALHLKKLHLNSQKMSKKNYMQKYCHKCPLFESNNLLSCTGAERFKPILTTKNDKSI